MDSATTNDILKLRMMVGYLGEHGQYGWWPTEFLSPASQAFLQPAFPRALFSAQYHGVSEAARRVHDEHIGVGHVFHLFRLPQELEQDLHSIVQRGDNKQLLGDAITTKQVALDQLKQFARSVGHVLEGPVAIGKRSDLQQSSTMEKIARAYLAAFENSVRTYPYVAG